MGANDIGIDLGTINTVIYNKNRGIVLNEPSAIAVESFSDKIMAVGREAKMMLGRTPDTVSAVRPLANGVIADFEKTSLMLKEYVKMTKKSWGSISAVVTVPYKATPVERRAVEDAVISAKVKKVVLIEKPLAAAIGCGLPIFEPKGHMIVDIGGGSTEIAVISLGGIVAETTLEDAGLAMDRNIIAFIRKNYNILIGDQVAEDLKIRLGSVTERELMDFMTVSGRDLVEGLPLSVSVSSDDVREAIMETVYNIIDGIKMTLEKIDPELAADIIENGIILVGGGSMLDGWSELISNETGLKAELAANPLESVAVGAGRALELINDLKKAATV